MLIAVETLIDGVVRTLTEAVLPDVGTRFARGQLYAVVDVLRNLRDRVEAKAALDAAEADSAAAALERVAALLPPFARERVTQAVVAANEASGDARADALRAVLVLALQTIDALPAEVGAAAARVIGEHLAAQALRDLALLKPSLLTEISKG